jgi:hypothetical protein
MHRGALISLCLTAAACAAHAEPRGDWCGTDRATLHAAGDLRQACALGDVGACEETGKACETSGGLFARAACDARYAPPWRPSADDVAGALALYEKWCALVGMPGEWGNHPEGCVKLARFYRSGRGVHAIDVARARALAVRACERGVHDGCLDAGEMEADAGLSAAAVTHFREACMHGLSAACDRLDGGGRCFQPVQPGCDRLKESGP